MYYIIKKLIQNLCFKIKKAFISNFIKFVIRGTDTYLFEI